MAKMNPPLRTAEDVAAIKQGLRDGTIDVIATDHAPHAVDEKAVEFDNAPFGVVGLETAVGLAFKLVQEGVLAPADMVRLMSWNPARIVKLDKGTLSVGTDADITIIDPNAEWTVKAAEFRSGQRTPCSRMKLKGKAVQTIVGKALCGMRSAECGMESSLHCSSCSIAGKRGRCCRAGPADRSKARGPEKPSGEILLHRSR
jgi:dihydroorotase